MILKILLLLMLRSKCTYDFRVSQRTYDLKMRMCYQRHLTACGIWCISVKKSRMAWQILIKKREVALEQLCRYGKGQAFPPNPQKPALVEGLRNYSRRARNWRKFQQKDAKIRMSETDLKHAKRSSINYLILCHVSAHPEQDVHVLAKRKLLIVNGLSFMISGRRDS